MFCELEQRIMQFVALGDISYRCEETPHFKQLSITVNKETGEGTVKSSGLNDNAAHSSQTSIAIED